jgi:YVTN family beta-propeller protein
MKSLKTTLILMALAVVFISTSCTKDDPDSKKGAFSNGIFIVNEGPFQTGTGTITYYNPDSNFSKQDIFELVNGRPLGNIVQSMTIYNGKGYIVVNNAGKVEVVDVATFNLEATITDLVNPNQFLVIDETKAYVSDWSGHVAVVDLNTNKINKKIPAGTGPDAMLKSGNYVYVANTGGFSVDSTVTVIDFITDKVVKTIKVGQVPTGIVADGTGSVWVMCKGIGFAGYPAAGDTPGSLIRINQETLTVDFTYKFSSTDDHPEKLVINKQKSVLYFLYNNGIYRFNIVLNNSIPERLFSRYFYSIGYENKTGYLYASDVKDYSSNGTVLRLKAEDGSVVDSIQAGIIPRGFVFPE